MAIKDNYRCASCGRTTYVMIGVLSKKPACPHCGGDLVPKGS